jgi:hypothetical protein
VLRLHRTVAGIAERRAARAAASAPVVSAQDVLISGAPGSGQPDITLDGPIDGYLWEALHADGVRVVDQTPQVAAAAVQEQALSAEGRLATPFVYAPLAANFIVRGEGTVYRNGRASVQLRLTDRTGAIVAIANAGGKARDLRDVVMKAVRDLAAQARAKLREAANPPVTCDRGGTSGCYGAQLTVEGIFDQTGGWGAGTAAAPAGHGSVTEGFDSVEHGYVGWWPAGTSFTLTATPSRGSHFDHWSGSCSGSANTCTLVAQPNLDVTAFFAEDLWTLTVVNHNPSGGEAYGSQIGCGRRDHTCSRVLAGQTSDADRFDLNVYPEASYMISSLQGCDQFDGSFVDGGNCWIDPTSDKTVTVDFACNPDATTPCGGTGAAADRR